MKAKELLDYAVDWLKVEYPQSIIVKELSVADWGGASIDVAAITENEIVGIEIKGEGDSPARLELQGLVYGRVARRMWLLADEAIQTACFKKRPKGWGRLEVSDGKIRKYNRATKIGNRIELDHGGYRYEQIRDESRYDPDEAHELHTLCPQSMCGTLWRDELHDIARLSGVSGVHARSRMNVWPLTVAICEQLPAPTIHTYMIDALRRREWRKPVIDMRDYAEKSAEQEVA